MKLNHGKQDKIPHLYKFLLKKKNGGKIKNPASQKKVGEGETPEEW